jgi:hypothetical protein
VTSRDVTTPRDVAQCHAEWAEIGPLRVEMKLIEVNFKIILQSEDTLNAAITGLANTFGGGWPPAGCKTSRSLSRRGKYRTISVAENETFSPTVRRCECRTANVAPWGL